MKLLPSLHVMTEYSLLESSIKIDDLIAFATKKKLDTLVITDHNNMFGTAEFIHKCKKNNIKPIIGLDLDVDNFRLILLAKNYDGFLELVKLSSKKNYGLKITISEININNLFVINHPQFSHTEINKMNFNFNNIFMTKNIASDNYINVTYTRFLFEEDINTMKIIDTLRTGQKQKIVVGSHYQPIDNSLPSYKQIKNIIDFCEIDFPQNINPIPKFDQSKDSKLLFRDVIVKNAELILKEKFKNYQYIKRLEKEVKIIEKLNFQDYFLIIYDLIKWSKKNNILIGPGRGSAAGSLVSFVLNITEVDPLEHGLLFERFLNPERVTMPDIDIDIQDDKRELVIEYLIQKYKVQNVGLISTFQRLAAKGSLREVGRIMNIPLIDILAITKLIGLNQSLEQAFTQSNRFKAVITSNEKYLELFENAKKIEGLPKNLGTHAAGVVITDCHLKSFIPTIKSSEGYTQIQYSMDYLEEQGLLKIDLLGLRNLTILEDIQKEIFKNHNRRISFSQIPYNDPKTNNILSLGNTIGIFQLESYGMKKTLSEVGISSLNDLVAVISLFRPGPMEFIKKYADVKNKRQKQELVDQEYDAILKPTYGIIVYQEQIMQIVQKYANMSFGQADILRRAIGKKDHFLINSFREEFIKNAIANNHTKVQADKIFKLIERFADYGFNKSHAVSYAMLGYRMAYLKVWFPFEFYTALIKSVLNSQIVLKQYINEAKQAKVIICPPKINTFQDNVFNKKPYIYLPLSIIKGVGTIANYKIFEEREKNGYYKDFFNFVARSKKNGISEAVILFIIKANALSIWGNMISLIDTLPYAIKYAEMITKVIDGRKTLDFELLKKPQIIVKDLDIDAAIKYENEAFGFNIALFKTSAYELNDKIIDVATKKRALVVTRIIKNKAIKDKNNKIMGIFKLEDSTMEVDVFAFENVYKIIKSSQKNQIVKVWLEYRNLKYIILKPWEVINEK